jgi:ABC-type maltose transport system permease subunit
MVVALPMEAVFLLVQRTFGQGITLVGLKV